MKPTVFAGLIALIVVVETSSGSARAQETQTPAADKANGTAVRLEADQDGARYLVRANGSETDYASVCVAPCDAVLPRGSLRVAVSRPGGQPVEAGEAVVVSGPATLSAKYTSNAKKRVAGWLVFGAATGFGVGVLSWGLMQSELECAVPDGGRYVCATHPNWASVLIGAVHIVVGSAVGLPLAFKSDRVAIEIIPDEVSRAETFPRGRADRGSVRTDAQGIAVRVTF